MFNKKNIYLDYASSTPINERVLTLMSSISKKFFANATSIHKSGVKARNIIEESREKIAKGLNAHSDEIIFTGSSTESNALAIIGVIKNYEARIKNEELKFIIPHIITTQIEHPAVLENCRMLEKSGEAEVTYLSVGKNGIVNLEELKESLKENTILVSIMYANNEIGSIQPIQEIAKIIRHYRKEKKEDGIFPVLHTDATQAMNYLYTANVEKLGIDMMSFNGSKIYGPKGTGVLYKKRSVTLSPVYEGGDQEFGLRSGTENVSAVAGLALAFEITNKMKERESERLTKLRDYAIEKILKIDVKPFVISLNGGKENRLPNNINISILGISSELLVIELDAKGIEVSSKSACKSGDDNGSYVIKAIRKICRRGNEEEGSLRITLGRDTKISDIDTLIKALNSILIKYQGWKK
jgi:cysteine desulfurase